MLFEVSGLTKVYEDRKVLDIPALEVEKGKVCGLLGPNGSGKTTLLEILSFLLPPSTGRIVYDSKEVDSRQAQLRDLRRQVVMVEQHPILFTTSVCRNVEFGLKVRKVPRNRREGIVREVLQLVGMGDFAEAGAHNLSGGETQRVAIARALACSPEAILFDEPTANVDVENQIIIERVVRDINTQKGISVIFTTHDRIQATRLADQLVFLFEGRPASSIYENLFSGSVTREGQGTAYCVIHEKVRLPVRTSATGDVKISVEPRKIRLFLSEQGGRSVSSMEGRVMQLTEEGRDVRALVDVGVPLSVLVDRNQYEKDRFLTGQRVRLVVPPESVEII